MLMVFWHPDDSTIHTQKGWAMPPPWALGLRNFHPGSGVCSSGVFPPSLVGPRPCGKQQDMAHQEDLELAQKGYTAELSISPSECPTPRHPKLSSRENRPITPQAPAP